MKSLKSLITTICGSKKFRRAKWLLTRDKPISGRYLDLAPVDNADLDGLYGNAIDFAMRNSAVRNIALTGPYGSGKTSVIKSYEKVSPYRFLNISLATFSDPNINCESGTTSPSEEVTVKVERSILQQMLYGSDTRTLPYSRFKRISKPRWLNVNALSFALWVVACGYIYQEKESILDAESVSGLEPLWVISGVYVFFYFAGLVARSLKASHSLSVKKLSLQNGEVELDGAPESSILNKHLDEIIYFFEENNYDVVAFEDLDRFGSPEIFIKLREINKIINDRPKRNGVLRNLKGAQPLKFIFAIKDDVFFNKDRAKFFDFIIPIVPVINSSNSREMFSKCMMPSEGNIGLDSKFLSEVSLYLDDYRLIKNISNEFLIYQRKIGGVPNLNKLLAMIVYKNTYPKDFEALHHGLGVLHKVVEQRARLITKAVAEIDIKIERNRELILESESEFCSAQEDLVRIFWGQLCGDNAGHNIKGVYAGVDVLTFNQILNWSAFKRLFGEELIRAQVQLPTTGYQQMRFDEVNLGTSFRALEEKISPGLKFEVRQRRIKNKTLQRRNQINQEIEELKEEKENFTRKPLRELIRLSPGEVDVVASDSVDGDFRLLNYLIRNGYLDETYHLYISIFHEGRMSRNDWNFIQAIRDFRSLDPNAQIDNPREVVSEMRVEDFGAEYVLNVALIDYLLTDNSENGANLRNAMEFISKHFAMSGDFFQSFWLFGQNVAPFTVAVSESWPDYGSASIGSDQAPRHIARIMAHVRPLYITENMNSNGVLREYLSVHAAVVFTENIPFAHGYEALKLMRVTLSDIADIADLDQLLRYVYENSLYALTVGNIDFVLSNFPGDIEVVSDSLIDSRSSNYTAIRMTAGQTLRCYVSENINVYLENVALVIDGNSEEDEDSVLEVINHPNVNQGLAIQFALRQNYVFESFDSIPVTMWGEFIFNEKVVIVWENILTYYMSEGSDVDRLNEMLDREDIANDLMGTQIPKASSGGDEESKALSLFIISNKALGLLSFEKLSACCPYIFKDFPQELPLDKKIILARLGRVNFNQKSYSSAAASTELMAELVGKNFDRYSASAENYPLTIDVKLILLACVTGRSEKYTVLKWITLDELKASVTAVDQVSQYFAKNELRTHDFDREVMLYCLVNCQKSDLIIKMLYNYVDKLTDDEVGCALGTAPEPYCHFIKVGTRQKLMLTDENLKFLKILESRHIISSISLKGEVIQVNAYRK